jgi:hypothetical protein
MCERDRFADGQPQPKPPNWRVTCPIRLLECLEDALQMLRRDADPGVFDLDFHLRLRVCRKGRAAAADGDRASGWGELDRVLQQIPRICVMRALSMSSS